MTDEDDVTMPEPEAAAPSDQYVRLAADFENFKRRKAQELADAMRYSAEPAAREILPILDNLLRSLDHAPVEGGETVSNFVNGIRIVVRELEVALERLGVRPIVAVGARFDPALHEAIGAEESNEVTEETVIAEIQRGYRLHDRVLRPTLVRVAQPASA